MATNRQFMEDLQGITTMILGTKVLQSTLHPYADDEVEFTITVNAKDIVDVLTVLRNDSNCLFHQLVDLCAVDYPERTQRFSVVYHLLSMRHNHRMRVKVNVPEGKAVPSVVGVFSTAGWFEREAWDLYGVFFDGNADLRRILTDYGFEGHPLRKDFPLTGHVEVRYDDAQRRVVYEPVKLVQEFRNFDFLSPWEGMAEGVPDAPLPTPLPGDEKAK